MRRPQEHPTFNKSLTLTTYATSATNANDTVTVATLPSTIASGHECVLTLNGGTANNVTSGATYYIVKMSATSVKLATSYANAVADTPVVVDISGDAGAGVLYPIYDLNATGDGCGFIYVGVTGSLNLKGRQADSWSLHKGLISGSILPFDIGKVHSYANGDTVASYLVLWY
jgi:hypothetical protein